MNLSFVVNTEIWGAHPSFWLPFEIIKTVNGKCMYGYDANLWMFNIFVND